MNLEQVRTEAEKLHNDLLHNGIYTSFRSLLETMNKTACEKKEYNKAHHIQRLIWEDINS